MSMTVKESKKGEYTDLGTKLGDESIEIPSFKETGSATYLVTRPPAESKTPVAGTTSSSPVRAKESSLSLQTYNKITRPFTAS